MKNLDDLFKFMTLMQTMRRVYRFNQEPLPDRGHYDTSVEHSYMVTMLAWYIMEKDKLDLDHDEVIKQLLVHDVVETYAGDTDVYDEPEIATKKDREKRAETRIKEEFPEFPGLHNFIETYENQDSRESKFAYAVDKLIDPICIYLDNGRTWKDKNNTLEDVFTVKESKIKISPEVYPYWQELYSRIEQEQDQLFN